MSGILPKAPFVPAAGDHHSKPVCEWIMPASAIRRSNYFSTYKVLPPGMPDCLQVSIGHSAEGTERCTAAIYGNHAYVIHYEFKPRR